jgi:hypothetical protein
MKTVKFLQFGWTTGVLALGCALLFSAKTVRANVYATDIQINGNLTGALVPEGSPLSITYHLNQTADQGVTVSVLNGATVVAAIPGGTNMGINSVSWTPANTGTYSVSITAAATGFTNWTQISVDSNPGMPAHDPLGIDVDKNTNSPYYGRVVMGCAECTGTTNVPVAAMQTGLFKMNADGSQADEGWYGNANYLKDDGKDAAVAGQMPNSKGYDPMKIRIGDDDRIYWDDNSDFGAIIACDMLATTNQIVINEAGYAGNPDYKDLISAGIQQFDVAFTTTTNASVWLGEGDIPNWGIWMYHLTNGAADPNDTIGTQAVCVGRDMDITANGGVMVDTNLDIFCGEDRNNKDPYYYAMVFPNWNGGVLPPEAGGNAYTLGTAAGQVEWGYGCGVDTTCGTDPSFEAVQDTVIDSRINPTIVACPMGKGSQFVSGTTGGGIRLLNATNGNLISVTNGATITTYSNLDNGQIYTCAAFDNVGNLYGASTSRNLWRVWSPPGPSTNTTVAVAQAIVQAPFTVTGITSSPTAPVTIAFTAPNLAASAFVLKGSATVNGLYTAVAGASITGSSGAYQATAANSSTGFYTIEAYFPGSVQIQNGCFTANASSFASSPGYVVGGNSPTNNPNSITGWTTSGTNEGVNGVAVTLIGSPFGPTVSAGYTYGFIENAGSMSQNLPLSPNTTYTLSFDAAARKGNSSSFQVQISDASQVYVSTGALVGNPAEFNHYSYTFTTPGAIAGMPSIQLSNVTPSGGDNTVCFSELTLTP